MLQHGWMCNLKFSARTGIIKCCFTTSDRGLGMSLRHAVRHNTRSGSELPRRTCPPTHKDVDQQEDRQSQSDTKMKPTRPRAQSFAARIVKAIPGNDQNGEYTQKQ